MSLFRQRGDARQQPGEQDKKLIEKRKIGVCLIVFGGLLAQRFVWFLSNGVRKREDT